MFITEKDRTRWLMPITFGYFLSLLSLGFVGSIFGSMLTELIEATHSDASQISKIFIWQGLGFILSSLTLSKYYDRLPGNKILSFAIVLLVGCMYMISRVDTLWMICAISFTFGISVCLVNIGTNTLMQWLHGDNMKPFLNAEHIFYAIGCVITPIILAEAFRTHADVGNALRILLFILSLVSLYLFILPSPNIPDPGTQKEDKRFDYSTSQRKKWLLSFSIGIFLFFVLGGHASFYNWISASLVHSKGVREETAAYYISIFWAGILIGRIISTVIIDKVNTVRYMLVSLLMAVVCSVILTFCDNLIFYAIITLLFGIAIGPQYANTFIYLREKAIITGKMNGFIFAIYQTGSMTIPWLVGQLVAACDYSYFMKTITLSFSIGLILFFLIQNIFQNISCPGYRDGKK
ncbi:MFS transporter [Flexilinea flocculi]|jgi:fucose permease|uniref:Major Facilitator Superfamily n=1 Tax=Flexilinea flocculi TaxID=1678840 RepID=A0A0S7BSK7_9CHLR|nr:MFS transporter [Flexilinea flocculi]GAP41483.1 major Facilitator Superfamily [Flexilinea flocculi]